MPVFYFATARIGCALTFLAGTLIIHGLMKG